MDATQWGMYINYADTQLDRNAAQDLYWRGSVTRLQRIKRAVDPGDVFYYPQSIQPSA
jgi:hypothetical protein